MEELYEHYATSLPAAANAESRRRLCGELEATEIEWSDPEALETKLCIKSFGLTLQNLHKWLLATPSSTCIQHDASETGTCMARIVLCNKELKRPWQASPAALRVVEHFDMRLAYEYARTCVSGTGKLFSRGNTTTYMLAHSKLVALWSVTRSPSPSPSPVTATVTIQAIMFASPGERARLQGLVAKPWNPSLTFHDMFPGLLCGLALSQEVDSVQEDINEAMRHVEVRTGHHNSLRGREEEPAPGSWGHLSAKMSGFARKLASTNRKIMVASELLGFITANSGSDSFSELSSSSSSPLEEQTETDKKEKGEKDDEEKRKWKGNQLTGNHVRLISARLDMQRVQNDFLVQKVNIQLTAVCLFLFLSHFTLAVSLYLSIFPIKKTPLTAADLN